LPFLDRLRKMPVMATILPAAPGPDKLELLDRVRGPIRRKPLGSIQTMPPFQRDAEESNTVMLSAASYFLLGRPGNNQRFLRQTQDRLFAPLRLTDFLDVRRLNSGAVE
jgi:hypothetical protein